MVPAGQAGSFAGGFSATPLIDMGDDTYLGFAGGLYPNGANTLPAEHRYAGLVRAANIQPRLTNGQPDPAGKYIFMSIGMSNTAQEFCGMLSNGVNCSDHSLMGQAADDPAVNHESLMMINGAKGGLDASTWDSPNELAYDVIRDQILTPLDLSEAQVQIIWLKVANAGAGQFPSLPDSDADAYTLLGRMGNIVRALKIRYPNLQQVFVASRIYAGYATSTLNPEPYAYESGFSAKWLIEAQINQMAGAPADPTAGDLNYDTVAAWVNWGPYLWADGLNPRSDGLIWELSDFSADGTHPSQQGEEKVADFLLDYFKNSAFTSCWFLKGEICDSWFLYFSFLPVMIK
jgi:hypothetical protein